MILFKNGTLLALESPTLSHYSSFDCQSSVTASHVSNHWLTSLSLVSSHIHFTSMSTSDTSSLYHRQSHHASMSSRPESSSQYQGVMASDEDTSKDQLRGTSRLLSQNTKGFLGLFVTANAFAVLSLILVLSWCNMLGGFGWNNPRTRFNWHPFLMVVGFVFFYGNGIMIYRLLRMESKPFLKWLHAGQCHSLSN